jgi:hypothetical protein
VRHRRIDVHQHIVPPAYARWLAAQGRLEAGGRALPEWSVDAALALMADRDIAHAVLSVSTPGAHLNPAVRRDPIARAQARPYAPPVAVGWFTSQLDAYGPLAPAGRTAIDRGTAAALFPRFAGAAAPEES